MNALAQISTTRQTLQTANLPVAEATEDVIDLRDLRFSWWTVHLESMWVIR